MKGVVFTPDEKMYVRDFGLPLLESVGEAVGGWIEIVHPHGLKAPYCMIVNEEGLLEDLPLNPLGCVLYQTMTHGFPIVGNIVVMKEGYVDGELDIVGLTEEEIAEIKEMAMTISDGSIEEVETE